MGEKGDMGNYNVILCFCKRAMFPKIATNIISFIVLYGKSQTLSLFIVLHHKSINIKQDISLTYTCLIYVQVNLINTSHISKPVPINYPPKKANNIACTDCNKKKNSRVSTPNH